MSHHQNAEQNHNKTDNRSFENVTKFKYMGTEATKQSYIPKEIKSKVILGKRAINLS